MPRVKRRSPKLRTFTGSHRKQLCAGHDFFNDAWGNDPDAIPLDEFREAWEHFRESIMREWRINHPGRQPVGWHLFNAPPKHRAKTISEAIEKARNQIWN